MRFNLLVRQPVVGAPAPLTPLDHARLPGSLEEVTARVAHHSGADLIEWAEVEPGLLRCQTPRLWYYAAQVLEN